MNAEPPLTLGAFRCSLRFLGSGCRRLRVALDRSERDRLVQMAAKNRRLAGLAGLAATATLHRWTLQTAFQSPEAVALARKLKRYTVNGHMRSLSEIAAELEAAGFVTRAGTRYEAAAIARMVGV